MLFTQRDFVPQNMSAMEVRSPLDVQGAPVGPVEKLYAFPPASALDALSNFNRVGVAWKASETRKAPSSRDRAPQRALTPPG